MNRPRNNRQRPSRQRKTAGRVDWKLARLFVGEAEDGRPTPAVRLTFAVVGRGTKLIWSHTPGAMQAGDGGDEFCPLMHLRGDQIEEYLTLLDRSAELVHLAEKKIEAERSGEATLTATIAEAVVGKIRS